MSFQANRRQSQPYDGGYALPIVIVVIAVGAMVAVALLGYAAALLRAGEDDADSLLHLYAADAGITAMRRQLEQGTPPPLRDQVMVEDIEVKVTAHTSTPTPTPDPDSPAGTLSPAPTPTPDKAFSLKLPNPLGKNSSVSISIPLLENSVLDIRWATTTPTSTPTPVSPSDGPQNPPYKPPSIKVYGTSDAGAEETPTPIATSVRCSDDPHCPDDLQDDSPEDYIWVRYEAPSPGDIMIVFNSGTEEVWTQRDRAHSYPNESSRTLCVIPEPASPTPNAELSTDYVVISKAGNTTVTAYIRRIIRWSSTPAANGVIYSPFYDEVAILSWKPYGPEPD